MKNDVLYYSVGALLYCPANKESIADSIIHEKFGNKFSLALCLEDTINDDFVTEAEQIERLTKAFKEGIEIITGFIIPKFNSDNATEYINQLIKVNELVSKKIYMMPIYENSSIIDLRNRTDILYSLKESLSPIEELVMNIRVGGNDLCHMFGFRRHSDESIHQIKPISNIFSDIITIYGMDYVVSGPVWEYYAGDNWEKGLIQEIQDDKLCGFTGKTVIHPNQIPIINRAYQVSRNDFNDAQAILNWNRNSNSFVSGNEYKTHINWAQKTVFLAEAYGITD